MALPNVSRAVAHPYAPAGDGFGHRGDAGRRPAADAAEALVTEDDAEAARLFAGAPATPDAERRPFMPARVKTFERLDSSAWAERAHKERRAATRAFRVRHRCAAVPTERRQPWFPRRSMMVV
ncbi:hypothetical protein GCM10010129_80390 [Streptomyces fumigatiscleroticus]|nr:hypothetical protein GCM10010129_80390 [Streptomyces fumigatiscleroticus]